MFFLNKVLILNFLFDRSLSKNVLRERVYCNCLDYFCREQQTPSQEADQLRDDIVTLIKFWQVIGALQKAMKTKQEFNTN